LTGPGAGSRIIGRGRLRLYAAASVTAIFVFMALLGPYIYDFDPVATNLRARLLPPGSRLPTGELMLLGTDHLGRDLLGQIIFGARVSLLVAVATVVIGGGVGTTIGLISGYFGGIPDSVSMRLADVQLAVPSVMLAILFVAVLGPSISTLIVALSISRWVIFARVARSSALVARARPFVDAARIAGLANWQILVHHIAPFTLSPILVIATLQIGLVILAEAALSFLGLGTSIQQPSWGLIISNGRDHLLDAWWISTLPGIALSLVIVSIAVLGDELRDTLDPTIRGR
jgi:peptide/nickel transport system permease protein